MSYNHNDPEKAARKHKPAIIAIVVALAVAVLAFLVFAPGANEQNDGIATTPPPAGTPMSDAEGLGAPADPVTPDANTPANAATGPVGTADQPAGAETAPAN
ncbi:MAG: hypothetical protein ACK4IA_10110 [Paracoccus hibiscisoli]|uniref:hypothetical protein n=1 Tax=Paracoccus hibiscisoli TaxID=2023261 RepID=UPI00391B92F5